MSPRKIIHVDMDCFYAAVEAKYQPELKGKAVGIGGPPNTRSVLCTASYEARKFGVRAAMPSSQALRLCPHLILLPPNFALYKKESRAVRQIFECFSDRIEPLSLDEAFLDVSESELCGGSPTLMAHEIRRLIREELHLNASAGVAPNKFLAKIASDWRKPNGQFVIRPEDVEAFMPGLPVEKIYGVGVVTAQKMHSYGLYTCGDLQRFSTEKLTQLFGSRGLGLSRLCRGLDDRPVEESSERKSLTVEETFHKDISSLDQCLSVVPELYEDWNCRMKNADCFDRIRGFVVKLKFFDFQSTTHETSAKWCPRVEDFADLIKLAWSRRNVPVRLVGLGVRLGSDSEPETLPALQLKLAI